MKKWQVVRRMTPKQKGEILKRLGKEYWLAKHHEYVVLCKSDGKLSDYILRRCPRCGYIDVWHTIIVPSTVVCIECRESSEVG